LIRRAICLRRLGRDEEALSDWIGALRAPGVSGAEILRAVNGIRELRPNDWVRSVESSLQPEKLGEEELRRVVSTLMSAPESVSLGISLIERSWKQPGAQSSPNESLDSSYVLGLIRLHRFDDAIRTIGIRSRVIEQADIVGVFNLAMAEWGKTSVPPTDLFARVIELDKIKSRTADANYYQCLALACSVTGNVREANKKLQQARREIGIAGRAFSCWSYLELPRAEFLDDLSAMEIGLAGSSDDFKPRFFPPTKGDLFGA
jgi:hypothetical protein